MSLAALVLAVVVSQSEPRLQVGVQGGYAQLQTGPLIDAGFGHDAPYPFRAGFELGVDARFRLVGPLSVGAFSTHGFSSGGEVIRVGGLVGVDQIRGLVKLSADLGFGYRVDTGGLGNGLAGQVDLAALWAINRTLSLGFYGAIVVTRSFGNSAFDTWNGLYSWFSVGLRGTANFL